MLRKITPAVGITVSALLVGAMVTAALLLALNQPWLGLRLAADEQGVVRVAAVNPEGPAAAVPVGAGVVAVGEFAVTGEDLVEEPDVLETYLLFGDFLDRQTRLAEILRGGPVTLRLDNGAAVTVTPEPARPVSSLPGAFWVQLLVGGVSTLIGAWVWSLRREDLGPRVLAGVGVATMISAYAAAVYSTRELAIDGGLFRVLSAMNHFGALGFGVCMIALFLVYPARAVNPKWLWVLPVIFGGWWLADTLQIGFEGFPSGSHLPTAVEMLGILVAVGVQYWKTRGDPRGRAALRWFALAVAIGAGAFVSLIIVPNLFGAEPMLSQGYAFLFFLLVFAGVALGVARYRLFELETWAFRILFYMGGVLLLLLLDAALIWLVSMEQVPAMSISLAVVALFYLPLRELLRRRLLSKRDVRESMFRQIMDVALTAPGDDQGARWRGLLQGAFDPLRIEPGEPVSAAKITDEGAVLALPAVGGLGALRLSHAHGGRKLFAPREAELAGELCAMLGHALESRLAYEKGVAAERSRIARDMHDNIGAQLLSALHSPAAERKDSMIRETLSDLRGIINNAAAPGQTLEEVLAELRYETAERLELAGVALEWSVEDGIAAPVSAQGVHALRSVLREAVSNVLKHAGASRLSVEVARRDGRVWFTVTDDGRGLPEPLVPGNGLGNIRARVAELGGTVEIVNARPGLRVGFGVVL